MMPAEGGRQAGIADAAKWRARLRRSGGAAVAVFALAFCVAAAVKRAPPDFAVLPALATVRDADRQPLWIIRLAAGAHEIAVDAVGGDPPPDGRAYQLWLAAPEGARSLGLLPVSGRKIIAEIPALVARLAGDGEFIVTLEPARGADTARPGGPVAFRAPFAGDR
jgi:anti-sigma-K factor RskA